MDSAPQTLLEKLRNKKKIVGNARISKGGEEWVLDYFPSSVILPIDKIKSETGLACIMDSSEEHMAIEFIEETYRYGSIKIS